jgi:hypothetical protein
MIIEALTEGASDVPVVREVLSRHFKLSEHIDFRIHPHRGRGNIPANVHAQPDPKHRGLLDQLPAKLRGFGKYMNDKFLVLVLIDADDNKPEELLASLSAMLEQLSSRPPRVLFRLAVEETESWFLADKYAISKAFPKANLSLVNDIVVDSPIGAWERLAECIGRDAEHITGSDKTYWAEQISPYLDFLTPRSPSLNALITGLKVELER